jgi:hypothetical protein
MASVLITTAPRRQTGTWGRDGIVEDRPPTPAQPRPPPQNGHHEEENRGRAERGGTPPLPPAPDGQQPHRTADETQAEKSGPLPDQAPLVAPPWHHRRAESAIGHATTTSLKKPLPISGDGLATGPSPGAPAAAPRPARGRGMPRPRRTPPAAARAATRPRRFHSLLLRRVRPHAAPRSPASARDPAQGYRIRPPPCRICARTTPPGHAERQSRRRRSTRTTPRSTSHAKQRPPRPHPTTATTAAGPPRSRSTDPRSSTAAMAAFEPFPARSARLAERGLTTTIPGGRAGLPAASSGGGEGEERGRKEVWRRR